MAVMAAILKIYFEILLLNRIKANWLEISFEVSRWIADKKKKKKKKKKIAKIV